MIGFFWGLVSGDMQTSLFIAIFFELFWLDLIPVGTFIPPHLTAAALAAMTLSSFLSFSQASQVVWLILACMPLAWLGAWMEGRLKERDSVNHNKLLNWARNDERRNGPASIVLRSLARSAALSGGTFFILVISIYWLFASILVAWPQLFSAISVEWEHLWVAATLGGLMALRLRRVYAVLGTGICLLALFSLWRPF